MPRLPQPPRRCFALLAIIHAAFLTWLSAKGGERIGPSLPGPSGNLLHLPAFVLLAVFVLRAQVPLAGWRSGASWPGLRTPEGWRTLWIVAAFALADEVHQFFVPGRSCSLADAVVDVLGALAVLLWPVAGSRGRPSGWLPLILAVLPALGIAVLGAGEPLPMDGVLDALLARMFGRPS